MSSIPQTPQTIELTKKNQKKLRFHKRVSLFLLSMLCLVTVMMAVLGFVFGVVDGEGMVGMLLLIVSVVLLLLTLWLRKHYNGLKSDLTGGVKEVAQGTIEDKRRYRANCDFIISGATYHVPIDHYVNHQIGDEVIIAFGPASKVILDIKKTNQKDEAIT